MHLTLQIVAKTLFNADISSETDKIGTAMTTLVGLFDFLEQDDPVEQNLNVNIFGQLVKHLLDRLFLHCCTPA